MAEVAKIAASLLSSEAQSGQKDNVEQANASTPGTAISNAQNNNPDIKTAEVKEVSGTPKPETPKAESSGSGGMDWEKLAKIAGQLENITKTDTPAPITANTISQASPLANFR